VLLKSSLLLTFAELAVKFMRAAQDSMADPLPVKQITVPADETQNLKLEIRNSKPFRFVHPASAS
jgi:hypothetical protein